MSTTELAAMIFKTVVTLELTSPYFWQAFWTVALGSVPFVIFSWLVTYYLAYPAIQTYQEYREHRRRLKLAERQKVKKVGKSRTSKKKKTTAL